MSIICFTKKIKKCNISSIRKVKMEKKKKFFIITISICVCMMLICGTILILPTSSWLSRSSTHDASGTVAKAGITVLNGSTTLTGNYSLTLGTSATTSNLKIKNTGTASEIVRLRYCIKASDNNTVLTSSNITVTFNTDFIAHERLDTTWSGYLFYNKALEANAIQSVITSITPLTGYTNTTVLIQISAEAVLYSGNAYTTGATDKYPWDSVPSNWFVFN